LVREELERCGIEFLVWLPDTEARSLYDSIMASPRLRLIQVCHEEEAMGVYTGLYLTGKKAAILIQNTGFFHSLDGLRGLILNLELPLLLMVGYRGYHELKDGKQPFDSAAVLTEPIMDTLGIKHYLMDTDDQVGNIGRAYQETMETNRPVAVLIGREYN